MPTSLPISAFQDWPVPNVNKGELALIFICWTNALCLIFTCLRIITRKWIVGASLWWDDWLTVAAMIGTAVGGAMDGAEIHYGFGRHEKYINEHQLMLFGAYTYCEWIQTFFTLCCTKLAICFFLLRIPTSNRFIRPLQVSIGALIVSHLIITFIWIFQCWPVQAAWNTNIEGHCYGRQFLLNLILSQAIISVFSDFALALCPIIILRHVHMRRRQKFGLCLLMGLEVIVGTCCTIRTAFNGGALPIDATYGGLTNWFWRLFEVQLGIVCACIPPLMPGYKWVRHKINSSWHGSQETTLTSQQLREADPTGFRGSPNLGHGHRADRAIDGSEIPKSEKGLMGKACEYEGNDDLQEKKYIPYHLKLDREASGQTDATFETGESSSDGRKASLGTFYDSTSDERLGRFPTPPRAPPAVHRDHAVSFSRRDLSRQAPLQLDLTQAQTNPRVIVTGDPSRSLDVNYGAGFERNRSAFSRVLELTRRSWGSWMSGSSSVEGSAASREGRGPPV